MKNLQRIAIGMVMFSVLFVPSLTFAATLSTPQLNFIAYALQLFGVEQSKIDVIEAYLNPQPIQVTNPDQTVGTQPVTNPITNPIAGSAPIVCPSSPTILVQPDYLNKTGIVKDIGTDIVQFPKAPYSDSWNYIDIDLKDSCVDKNTLTWTYTTPNIALADRQTQSWEYPKGTAVPIEATSTVQTVVITATEPGGQTTTRTLTILGN